MLPGSSWRPLIRHALLYGGVLAILALAAALIDFRLTLGGGPARLSGLMLALLFSGLGIWLGLRLFHPSHHDQARRFASNHEGLARQLAHRRR